MGAGLQLFVFSLQRHELQELSVEWFNDLLVTTFASVEDSAPFIGASKLLGMVEHLCPLAYRTVFLYDCLRVEFIGIQGLDRGVL